LELAEAPSLVVVVVVVEFLFGIACWLPMRKNKKMAKILGGYNALKCSGKYTVTVDVLRDVATKKVILFKIRRHKMQEWWS